MAFTYKELHVERVYPGGYRIVSTYDLPGCKTILILVGGGGVILKLSDLDSLTIVIFGGGGYSVLQK